MGEISQDTNRGVSVKTVKPCFSLYYGLFTYLEFGSMEAEDLRVHLLEIKKLLAEKYGADDFRTKFLTLCILKNETHEVDSQDKDQVRYILHAECEPEDLHTVQLEDLKERMEKEKQTEYWHCDHCGYEHMRHLSGFLRMPRPDRCPECKHSKDWQSGRTANCSKCENYSICHEPTKGCCPEFKKTCLYFKEIT